MNRETRETNLLTRRSALRVIGVGVVTSSTALAAACSKETGGGSKKAGGSKKQPAAKTAQPAKAAEPAGAGSKPAAGGGGDASACADPAKLDQQSKTMRSTLKYVEKSTKEGQQCNGCLQWIPGPKPDACGGCKLFSGGVNPQGYCLSWAKKGDAAGAEKKAG